MEPIAYLRALRRRWRIVAACLFLALAAAWATTPAQPSAQAPLTTYATSVTLVPPWNAAAQVNLPLAAFLARQGDVAKLAAQGLRDKSDPATLLGSVTATADTAVGSVTITAQDRNRDRSVAVARAFANATVTYMQQFSQKTRESQAKDARNDLQRIDATMHQLQQQVDDSSGVDRIKYRAQLTTEQSRYQLTYQRLQELLQPVNPQAALRPLGSASTEASAPGGLGAPSTRGGRLLIAGALGLLLGCVAALVVDRLDVRLRSREAVEIAFGAPVLAEVPRVRSGRRHRPDVVVVTRPTSAAAEAHRTLRSAVLLAPLEMQLGHRAGGPQLPDGPQVILVASARSRDGKTTTVANLAAALAEAERSVLVLDCDLRKPDVHRHLDAAPGLGLAEVVRERGTQALSRVVRPSSVPGVSVVTAGQTAPENPASILLRIGAVIEEARGLADFVLIDSAPLLVANDTNDLLQYVDAVLLTCRVGLVSAEQAGRVRHLLDRSGKPVIGITLVGIPTAPDLHTGRGTSSGPAPRLRTRLPFVPRPDERADPPEGAGRKGSGPGRHLSDA
jgi:capsular exopolysaccharide synthesis family protein